MYWKSRLAELGLYNILVYIHFHFSLKALNKLYRHFPNSIIIIIRFERETQVIDVTGLPGS